MRKEEHQEQSNESSSSEVKEDLLPASIFQNTNSQKSMHNYMTAFFSQKLEAPFFEKECSHIIMKKC